MCCVGVVDTHLSRWLPSGCDAAGPVENLATILRPELGSAAPLCHSARVRLRVGFNTCSSPRTSCAGVTLQEQLL